MTTDENREDFNTSFVELTTSKCSKYLFPLLISINFAENTTFQKEYSHEREEDSDQFDENGCQVDSFPELKTLFDNERLSDYTLIIGKNSIRVHNFVLSIKSPVFASNISDLYTSELNITTEDFYSFRQFIKFFYTERFPIDANTKLDHIKRVYELAKQYQVPRLERLIDDNMNKSFTLDNFAKVILFARTNNLNKTVSAWQQYVRQNSDTIFREKRYLAEDAWVMENIMYSMDLNEKQKTMAMMTIKRERRDVDMTRYKNLVSLPDCDVEQLKDLRNLNMINETELWDQVIAKFHGLCQIKQQYNLIKQVTSKEREQCSSLRTDYNRLQYLYQDCAHPRPINQYSPYADMFRPSPPFVQEHGRVKRINV